MEHLSVWYDDISKGRCNITVGDGSMTMGKIIREYRKSKHMTQEEMARRLGVTAPAVNKWENENSYPDIFLLAPIARLLDISLDTLLSFQEDLTDQEINAIIQETDLKLKEESYDVVFRWAKKKLEQYPNSKRLILQMAVLLDTQRIIQSISDEAKYDKDLCTFYISALESEEEGIRTKAAECLVDFYMRKKQYHKAEEYLEYFSIQNPERKRKRAQIYSETNRFNEAYKAYEELLFSHYQAVSVTLHGLYMLALKEGDRKKAHMLVAKQGEMAKSFEMGRYHEFSCKLDVAVMEKDADMVLATAEEILSSIESIGDFRKSALYEHLEFQKIGKDFLTELKEKLLRSFQDEERFGFLRNDIRWRNLIQHKG